MVWTATISSKGQLVLPKAVREKLGAGPGSKILVAERDGRFELMACGGDILEWYGAHPVEGVQDWQAVKRETGLARAREVIRESEGD